ncbi:hypothetical protein LTR86_011320, partial [Recurvomyces mirabilis]
MGTVIMSDGLERGLSRNELQSACSAIRSKKFCGRIAKVLRLPEWVKISERQIHIGIQPTTLKNAVAALVGAVWMDSHDYKAVLRAMISIGLLNHAKYYDELQDTLLMDVPSAWSFDDMELSYYIAHPGEEDDIFDDYWSLLPEGDRSIDDPYQLHSNHGRSPIAEVASTIDPTSLEPTLEFTSPSSTHDVGRDKGQELSAPPTATALYGGSAACAAPVEDVAAQAQQSPSGDKTSKASTNIVGRISKRSNGKVGIRGLGRPRADNITCIVETYVNHQSNKDMTPQDHTSIANLMAAYHAIILRAPVPSQRSLGALVTSIGDSSALLLLKEAIQGLRTPRM